MICVNDLARKKPDDSSASSTINETSNKTRIYCLAYHVLDSIVLCIAQNVANFFVVLFEGDLAETGLFFESFLFVFNQ